MVREESETTKQLYNKLNQASKSIMCAHDFFFHFSIVTSMVTI